MTRSTAKHQKGNPKRKTETVIILELNQTTEELPTLKQWHTVVMELITGHGKEWRIWAYKRNRRNLWKIDENEKLKKKWIMNEKELFQFDSETNIELWNSNATSMTLPPNKNQIIQVVAKTGQNTIII